MSNGYRDGHTDVVFLQIIQEFLFCGVKRQLSNENSLEWISRNYSEAFIQSLHWDRCGCSCCYPSILNKEKRNTCQFHSHQEDAHHWTFALRFIRFTLADLNPNTFHFNFLTTFLVSPVRTIVSFESSVIVHCSLVFLMSRWN